MSKDKTSLKERLTKAGLLPSDDLSLEKSLLAAVDFVPTLPLGKAAKKTKAVLSKGLKYGKGGAVIQTANCGASMKPQQQRKK